MSQDNVYPKKRNTRWWAAIAILSMIAVVAAIVVFRPYSADEFRGDGLATDTGFWSYPRYHVRFPEMSLAAPGQRCFACAGLPPVPLTLTLKLVGTGNYGALSNGATCVSVTLVDSGGNTVCTASGPLRNWILQWVPANRTGAFWHPALRDFRVNPRQAYTLKIAVTEVTADSGPITIVPTLEGGGNESL